MATGDVFADTNFSIADLATVTVQPAAGVSVMISFVNSQNDASNSWGGENATGQSASFYQGNAWAMSWQEVKIFITNSQYIYFKCDNGTGAAKTFSYSGIEI